MRRWAALVVLLPVLVTLGVSGLAGVAGSQEDQPLAPTAAGIGGFDLRSQSASLLINVDTPNLALPRLAQIGIPYAFTSAVSGPSGRAVGSVLWPGPVVADPNGALQQVGIPLPVPGYPIRAQATYPSDELSSAVQPAPGVRMVAEAQEKSLHALATYPGVDLSGLVTVGSMSATSDTTLDEGLVTTTTRSEATGIELLGGMIRIGVLVSRAEAMSNGSEGRASGSLSPVEVTVAGQPAAFGSGGEGLVIPGREAATTALNQFLEQIGMEIRLLPKDIGVDQGTATVDVSGLFVRFAPSTIGGGVAGSVQQQLTALLSQLLGSLSLPPELGNVLNTVTSLVAADYRISFLLGTSSAAVLASPGFGGFVDAPMDLGTDTPLDTGGFTDLGGSFQPPSLTTGGEVPLTPSVVDGGTPSAFSSGGGESFAPFDTTSAADTAVPAGAVLAALLAAPAFAGLARRFGMFALSPPAATCPLEKSPKEL